MKSKRISRKPDRVKHAKQSEIESPECEQEMLAWPSLNLKAAGHRDFAGLLSCGLGTVGDEKALKTVGGLIGVADPSDDHHLGSLHCREALASDLIRRMVTEINNSSATVCHVAARLPLSTIDPSDAIFDGIASPDARELARLSANQYWIPAPRFAIYDQDEKLELVLEALLFEEGLDGEIEQRIREPNFRLARSGQPTPLTFTLLGRDEAAIRSKIRAMCCVQRAHVPVQMEKSRRVRAAHRLLHVRSMIEARQLKKVDRGEGRVHMMAALEAARRLLPDRKASATSAAPRAQRARDVVRLMRTMGFSGYELPFIKF